jgi:flagellar operon protein (TIGR03826 family)
MSLDKLRNCPRCDDLFVIITRNLCPACVHQELKELETCHEFLRSQDNERSTIVEMSEQTGVSISQITQFILDKRIFVEDNPNMSYPCDSCEKLIRSGRFCVSCTSEWERTVELGDNTNSAINAKRESRYYIHNKSTK